MSSKRKPTDRTQPSRGFKTSRSSGRPTPVTSILLDAFVIAEFATNQEDMDEVHILLQSSEVPDMPTPVMRFKGPDTLGFFIEELIAYRRAVWPDASDPNFDARVLPADDDDE